MIFNIHIHDLRQNIYLSNLHKSLEINSIYFEFPFNTPYALAAESVSKSEPKIFVSPNEAYASVELHKPEEVHMHIYEELSKAAQCQETVITTRNEAYASWTIQ